MGPIDTGPLVHKTLLANRVSSNDRQEYQGRLRRNSDRMTRSNERDQQTAGTCGHRGPNS